VVLWRLSNDLRVTPLPWLSMLPVGEDCPELLTVLREPAFGPTRSLLVMLSYGLPFLLGYCLPEGMWGCVRDFPLPEAQPLFSICMKNRLY